MRRFIAKEDIIVFGKKIISKDENIWVSEETEAIIEKDGFIINLTLQNVLSDNRFQEINDISIREITDVEEEEVKNWRIQLEVKCSRKKLRSIENILRQNLSEILN